MLLGLIKESQSELAENELLVKLEDNRGDGLLGITVVVQEEGLLIPRFEFGMVIAEEPEEVEDEGVSVVFGVVGGVGGFGEGFEPDSTSTESEAGLFVDL